MELHHATKDSHESPQVPAAQADLPRLSLALVPGSKMLPPERRTVEVRLAGTDGVTSVTFEGEPVELSL